MSFVRRLRLGNHRGDTIVEVMVVLAILGMAVGISYSTANNSLLDIRQSEEHAQATEYTQSQIEIMRTMLEPGSPNIFVTGPFCLSQTAPYTIETWPTATTPNANCLLGPYPYTIKVSDLSVANPSLPPGTFQILVQWPDVRGQSTDSVTLTYQLHQSPPP
jgi:prepilin-type N-terminal cleavage/methylation domain-containing protein